MSPADHPPLRILQLYPQQMNIYGDWGNTLTLMRRARWAGFEVEIASLDLGGTPPSDVDLVVGGGGQDSGQVRVARELADHGPRIHEWVAADVPMLMICGSYQLFGHEFVPAASDTATTPLTGISVFDAHTRGSSKRLIGNLTVDSDLFGPVIGYENHSGLTTLGPSATALGTVREPAAGSFDASVGAGNNGQDGTEGAITRHVIGTYLHGSLLPKNPAIADWLLARAVRHSTGEDLYTPPEAHEALTRRAREVAMSRPR